MSHLPSLADGTLIDVFGRSPETFARLHAFGEKVMRGPSLFPPGDRELMAAYVSRLNGCRFCELSHAEAAAHFGVDKTLVSSLADDVETAGVSEDMRPVFRYLRKLTHAPADVGAADVRAVLDAGWSEDAVIGANLVCGFFSMMNRLVDGLGIEADPQTVAMAGKQLHDRGYGGIGDMIRQSTKPA